MRDAVASFDGQRWILHSNTPLHTTAPFVYRDAYLFRGRAGFDLAELAIRSPEGFQQDTFFVFRHGSLLEDGSIDWRPYFECRTTRLLERNRERPTSIATLPTQSGLFTETILTSDQGRAWYIRSLCAEPLRIDPLTGNENGPDRIEQLVIAREGPDRVVLFARERGSEELGPIWIKRQNNPGANFVEFDDWEELDNDVRAIAAPGEVLNGGELYALTRNLDLYHLFADVDDETWHQQTLETPDLAGDEVEEVAGHCLELTTVSDDETAIPNTEVALTSSAHQFAFVNGEIEFLDPVHPLVCETDDLGHLTIKIRADEITTPHIDVHVPDYMPEGETETYSPAMATYRRIAGKEPGISIDGETLKENGVLPDMPQNQLDEFAELIQTCGERMLACEADVMNAEATTRLEDMEPVAWVFDFTTIPDARPPPVADRGRGAGRTPRGYIRGHQTPVLRVLRGDAALSLDFQELAAANASLFPQDELFFRKIGDVFRQAKSHLEDITRLVVRVIAGKIDIIMNALKESLNFVREGIEAGVRKLADVLTVALERIAAQIERGLQVIRNLIEFVKALFSWGDILRTKRVFDFAVNRFLDNMERSIGEDGVELIEGAFNSLDSQLEQFFSNIRRDLGDRNIDDLVTLNGNNPREDTSGDDNYQQHANMCNFGLSLVESYAPEDLDLSDLRDEVMATSEFEDFINAIEDFFSEDRYRELADRYQPVIESFFTMGGNVGQLFKSSLELFLLAFEDLTRFAAEFARAVLGLMFRLVARVIGIFRDMFNNPIEIPVLTPLYRTITGEADLRTLDLLTLTFAIPATLLYRVTFGLVNGGGPPFREEDIPAAQNYFASVGDLRVLIVGPESSDILLDTATAERMERINQTLVAAKKPVFKLLDKAEDALAMKRVGNFVFNAITLGYQGLIHVTGFPYAATMERPRTPGNAAILVNWVVDMSPWLSNSIVFVTTLNGNLRTIEVVGPLAESCLGATKKVGNMTVIVLNIIDGKYIEILRGAEGFVSATSLVSKNFTTLAKSTPTPINLIFAGAQLATTAISRLGALGLEVGRMVAIWTDGETTVIPEDLNGETTAWMFVRQD